MKELVHQTARGTRTKLDKTLQLFESKLYTHQANVSLNGKVKATTETAKMFGLL